MRVDVFQTSQKKLIRLETFIQWDGWWEDTGLLDKVNDNCQEGLWIWIEEDVGWFQAKCVPLFTCRVKGLRINTIAPFQPSRRVMLSNHVKHVYIYILYLLVLEASE